MGNRSTNVLPASAYRADWRYAAAEAAYLLRSWVFVGHVSELSQPGDVIVESILGRPLLVRRSEDGELRAFLNICRHRSGPIVDRGARRCKILKCRYHGWVYDQAGELVSTPGFANDEQDQVDMARYRLAPLAVDVWRGLVFVNLHPEEMADRMELAGLSVVFGDIDPGAFEPRSSLTFRFECNWKLYVENWLESYHIPWVHGGLSKDVEVRRYDVECRDRLVIHRAPRISTESVYGGLWVWLAPCTAINVYDGGVSVERILPVGPTATGVDYKFIFRPGISRKEVERTLSMCREVTTEDGRMCEVVQSNMNVDLPCDGPLSPDCEAGIAHFQKIIQTAVGDECATVGGCQR
jgi:choline monooxygenase